MPHFQEIVEHAEALRAPSACPLRHLAFPVPRVLEVRRELGRALIRLDRRVEAMLHCAPHKEGERWGEEASGWAREML